MAREENPGHRVGGGAGGVKVSGKPGLASGSALITRMALRLCLHPCVGAGPRTGLGLGATVMPASGHGDSDGSGWISAGTN